MPVGNHTLPTELMRTCTDGTLWCILDWANNVTNGLFMVLTLLSFCIVVYLSTARLGSVRAFGAGTFVGLIGSIWLVIMGLIEWWVASGFILLGVIGVVVMLMSERP